MTPGMKHPRWIFREGFRSSSRLPIWKMPSQSSIAKYRPRVTKIPRRTTDLNPELQRGRFSISTDPARMDVAAVHAYLSRSYWAEGIPKETVAKSLECSLCFGLFDESQQIGLARVVTDR